MQHSKLYWDNLQAFAEDCKSDSLFNAKDTKPVSLRLRNDQRSIKSLFCHDYKGGYYEEADEQSYTFKWWHLASDFVYFSHHRISPPPLQWITAAHKNGVKIYGTLIFEHAEGSEDAIRLLLPSEDFKTSSLLLFTGEKHPFSQVSTHYADMLVDLAVSRGFDGWLLNFECSLGLPARTDEVRRAQEMNRPPRKRFAKAHARALVAWVAYLSREIKRRIGNHAETIWYDSVTNEGELQWQCSLSPKNTAFAKAAGNIFLDYHWSPSSLRASSTQLPIPRSIGIKFTSNISLPSHLDSSNVFVGIDCFGRGQFGDGGFQSGLALREILKTGLSAAVFGFGWLEEGSDLPPDRTREQQFDDEVYFYTGGTPSASVDNWRNQLFDRKHKEAQERKARGDNADDNFQLPSLNDCLAFQRLISVYSHSIIDGTCSTNFCFGSGSARFENGIQLQAAWTDMAQCQPQPDLIYPVARPLSPEGAASDQTATATVDSAFAFNGGQSLLLQKSGEETMLIPLFTIKLDPGSYIVEVTSFGAGLLQFGWRCESDWKLHKLDRKPLNLGWIQHHAQIQVEASTACIGISFEDKQVRIGEFAITLDL